MINVSLNDLMVSNDLPAPRTASRPEASAFAALIGDSSQRQHAAPPDRARDRATETRDATRAPMRNTTNDDRRNADERTVRNTTSSDRRGSDETVLQTTPKPTRADVTPERRQNTGTAEQPTNPNPESTGTDTDIAAAETGTKTASSDSPAGAPAEPGQTIELPGVALGLVAPPVMPMPTHPVVPALGLVLRGPAVAALPGQAAPTHLPEQASPVAPLATNRAAPLAATPAAPQATATLGHAGQPAFDIPGSTPNAISADVPVALPAAAGRPFADTLFAATLLSQSATPDRLIIAPPGANPQAAPLTDSAFTGAPSTGKPLANALPLNHELPAAAPLRASEIVVPAQPEGPSAGPSLLSQQRAHLGALLDTQNIDIQVRQSIEFATGKPAPALANGMAAQIAQPQQAASPSPSGTSVTTPVDGLATANAVTTQTATAVAAAPVTQLVADEPRPKFAANQDSMAVNAQAPIGARVAPGTGAEHTAPAKFTVPPQPATDQVAVHIAKAIAEGSDKISIKLKPASLGQIEVRLEVAADGRVHAVIAADRPETLDLLQRDARGLERALNEAGLRADSGSLSFNLRGQGQPFGGSAGNGGFASAAEHAASEADLLGKASRIGAYLNSRAAAGGVDIRV